MCLWCAISDWPYVNLHPIHTLYIPQLLPAALRHQLRINNHYRLVLYLSDKLKNIHHKEKYLIGLIALLQSLEEFCLQLLF